MNRIAANLLHRTKRLARARCVKVRAFAVIMLTAFAGHSALAQDDTPTRVGRVADVGGQLFYSTEDEPSQWQAVGLNYPIASGANLWVSQDGRAEIDFGGTQLRLAGDANVHVSRLDGEQFALFVGQGAAIVRLRALEPGDSVHIDTPNAQVVLTRTGLYRIDVSPDREGTTLIVREGEAEIAIASGSQQVLPGQKAEVRGAQPAVVEVRNGVGVDGFDAWNVARDRYYEQSRTPQYVSSQMVGAADLARYGRWEDAPEYGPVWMPENVGADWAPYSDGYWTSLPSFGWTWVDVAPWGYAPFHYGRWVSWRGRWAWCPGNYVARPAWAPALVAWYGGGNWRFAGSGGPIYGWVPLSWREAYVPAWRHCDARCYARYNRPFHVDPIERNHVPPATYANASVPGAVTAVAGSTLVSTKPIAANRLSVPPTALVGAPVLATAPQLKPAPAASPQRVVIAPAATATSNPRPPLATNPAEPWRAPARNVDPPSGQTPARPSAVPPASPAAAVVGRAPVSVPPVPSVAVPTPPSATYSAPTAVPSAAPVRAAMPPVPANPVPVTAGVTRAPVAAQSAPAGSVAVPVAPRVVSAAQPYAPLVRAPPPQFDPAPRAVMPPPQPVPQQLRPVAPVAPVAIAPPVQPVPGVAYVAPAPAPSRGEAEGVHAAKPAPKPLAN
jgi:hypothetical protein